MNQHPTSCVWDDDDNKPVIPKIPRPRSPQATEPSDLAVAVGLGRRVLGSDNPTAVREALRILLRALDAEPVDEAEAVRRSVDAHFPAVAAFLAAERGDAR